jgi:hypothetical protein
MGRRRTEAMINLEARHPFAQSTPVVAHRPVGKNDDEIDVGDTREATFRRTAEQEQTHRRRPVPRARLDDRVEIVLNASG